MKYRVEKSCVIDAELSTVRPLVEDFSNWKSWSPWTVAEPECPVDIEGSAGQPGHSMEWNGSIIGSGKNTLVENRPSELTYDLEFYKPFKSRAKVQFVFKEQDGKTQVTWSMDSKMPFFLFFLVKMMKNWIGMDYQRGLRMLKEVAEKGRVNCKTTNSGMTNYEGFSYIGLKRIVDFEQLPDSMKADFGKIVEDVVHKRGKGARHWLTIYPKFDMRTMKVTYIAAVSDEDLKDNPLGSEYMNGEIKSSKALEIKHDGAYDFLGNAWSMGMMYNRAKKHKASGYPIEQYWNSPMEVAPDDLKTSIYFPVKE